jgi:osmoprotectant transport system permease protein
MFEFMLTHGPEILKNTTQHITLSLSSVLLACLVGIPLGFFIVGRKRLSSIVLGIANIIQTIPSLAMFAFALPLFGIGIKPAIFALFLYALLPILKNTLLGIRSVDPAIIKAAKGMGMSKTQIMFMVEVPLSISIIMGGIRIATVTSIGVTTIATLIAAGGLGDFIYQGLSTYNQPMILTGAILSALLALIADFFLGRLEKRLTSNGLVEGSSSKGKKKKHTKRNLIIIIAILVIGLGTLIGLNQKKKNTITIVNKNYTEQRLMGHVISQYLEGKGFDTEVKELGGTMLCFNAIKSGDADMYSEYTGTLYTAMFNHKNVVSAEETYEIVKRESEEQFGITLLDPYGFNNTYALSVTQETADKYNLKTISDLESHASELLVGGDSEFAVRESDGLPAVQKKYGFTFKGYKSMDQGLTYQALVNGDFDVSSSYATDGRIAKFNLVLLEDDKSVFPPYFCTPLMTTEFAQSHPKVVEELEKLKNIWTNEDLQKYNLMIDEGKKVSDVATLMLNDKNLL